MKREVTTTLAVLVLLLSCGGDDRIDREAKALYESGSRIKPLAEYTEENPREWKSIASEHIPIVRKTIYKGRNSVLIEVPLRRATTEHYIQRIGILDEHGKEIASTAIPRIPNPPVYAYFDFDGLPFGKNLKAYARCNLHDTWVTTFTLEKLE